MKKIIASICFVLASGLVLHAQTGTGEKTTTAGTDAKANAKTIKTAEVKKQDATSKQTTTGSTESSAKGTAATGTSASTSSKEASVKPASAGSTAESKDYVKFDKLDHDYGTVKKGANGDCSFTYKNTGKTPLIITTCYGSCGCTVPKWEKEPLMPGKSFDIKVHYDTNRPGKFEKTVTINFQDHSEPVVLHIKGVVEVPPADVPFGSEPSNTGAPLEKGNN